MDFKALEGTLFELLDEYVNDKINNELIKLYKIEHKRKFRKVLREFYVVKSSYMRREQKSINGMKIRRLLSRIQSDRFNKLYRNEKYEALCKQLKYTGYKRRHFYLRGAINDDKYNFISSYKFYLGNEESDERMKFYLQPEYIFFRKRGYKISCSQTHCLIAHKQILFRFKTITMRLNGLKYIFLWAINEPYLQYIKKMFDDEITKYHFYKNNRDEFIKTIDFLMEQESLERGQIYNVDLDKNELTKFNFDDDNDSSDDDF